MQLIPRGAMEAAGQLLPPHYIAKVEDRWCLYCGSKDRDAKNLILVGDGDAIPDAYQAWLDVLGIPALVYEDGRRMGWVRLRFEDLRDLGLTT